MLDAEKSTPREWSPEAPWERRMRPKTPMKRTPRQPTAAEGKTVEIQPIPAFCPAPRARHEAWQLALKLQSDAGELTRRLEALGLADVAPFGAGGSTEAVQDMSAALHLLWFTLQHIHAWTQYGMGDDENDPQGGWPIGRTEIRRATHIVRGGSRAGGADSNGHANRMALSMARQSLGRLVGVGFSPVTEAEAVAYLRDAYVACFGTVFATEPSDREILNAMAKARSRVSKPHRNEREFVRAFGLASAQIAGDVLTAAWRAALRSGLVGNRGAFRFPLEPKGSDKATRLALLKRLNAYVA